MQNMIFRTLAFGMMTVATSAFAEPVAVNTDNFIRAESDLYFSGVVANGGFGKLDHTREIAPLDKQTVIRLNRDTLYSSGVFDLDAGPVTVTLPELGGRFVSMQVIDEDHFTHDVHYEAGTYTLTRDAIGTRYVLLALRLLADPSDPDDLAKVHALQDAIRVEQDAQGSFDVPEWDQASQNATRKALLELAAGLPDTARMFGSKDQVDPVRRLIGAALGWGGNPDADALYLNRTEADNDGQTVYRVQVGTVPVKSFWSISVYNADGYFTPNELNAYTVNDITAQPDADGGVTVQFGGCDSEVPNCLPITEGWNWMVRLYRPGPEILSGAWQFPQAQKVAP
ncbi:DUF1254 domain-containing protein [Paracoccus methylovorus]|uniref:DUF1254 domain-containing protein n=1 Tax=Paracoccus methylovorus TaxID=2812658 RepID=A0ABX7JGQ6_9RHOB|nr:DUF1254 domain-containing protein [Paracoccus methylovorus]QRZ12869.1 DUF1254 domain-containing protein [Paracoccus methylovorus]